jgi:hypothetical protein
MFKEVPKKPEKFSENEIALFKPLFVSLAEKKTTTSAIRETLGSDEVYNRFLSYARIAKALLQKRKLERETKVLTEQKEILLQKADKVESVRQESREKTISAIAEELGNIKIDGVTLNEEQRKEIAKAYLAIEETKQAASEEVEQKYAGSNSSSSFNK